MKEGKEKSDAAEVECKEEKPVPSTECAVEDCWTKDDEWKTETADECAKNLAGTCEKAVKVTCEETINKLNDVTEKDNVHKSFCDDDKKPSDSAEECAIAACQTLTLKYKVVEAESCTLEAQSQCQRVRSLECWETVDFDEPTKVDLSDCSDLATPDTAAKSCNPRECVTVTYQWVEDETVCTATSESSGDCKQTISHPECKELWDDNFKVLVSTDKCADKPDDVVKDCDPSACSSTVDVATYTYAWSSKDGGVCGLANDKCVKDVMMSCMRTKTSDQSIAKVVDTLCEETNSGAGTKPAITADCDASACVTYAWTTTAEDCAYKNSKCEQQVDLGCKSSNDVKVDISYCDSDGKLSDAAVECVDATVCDNISYSWFTTDGTCARDDSGAAATCAQTPVASCVKTVNGVSSTGDASDCAANVGIPTTNAAVDCNWESCATYAWDSVDGGNADCAFANDACTRAITVTCQRTADTVTTADNSKCSGTSPAASATCDMSICVQYKYTTTTASCAANTDVDQCQQEVTKACVKTVDGVEESAELSVCAANNAIDVDTTAIACEWSSCPDACNGGCANDPVCSSSQFLKDAATHCCPALKECAQSLFVNKYSQEVSGITTETCPSEIENIKTAHKNVLGLTKDSTISAECPSRRRRALAALTIDFAVTSSDESLAFAVKAAVEDSGFTESVNGQLSIAKSAATADSTTPKGLERGDGQTVTYQWLEGPWNTACDATCGVDTLAKTKSVTCVVTGTTTVSDDNYCSGTKPTSSQLCNLPECTTIGITKAPDTLESSSSSICLLLCFIFMMLNYF